VTCAFDLCWNRKDHQDVFKNPVSKQLVPDYFDIIKNPMCWSQIDAKLDSHEYWEANELRVCDFDRLYLYEYYQFSRMTSNSSLTTL
jgi:hypothetical protein